MTDSRWGLALMVATGACAVASSGCLHRLYEKDCLEFAALELGDVPPSSRRRLELPLLNCGRRTIAAIDARPSCGCVRHTETRFELLPGHRHTIAFEVVAPATPGPFEKRVVLSSGSQQWTVPLRGIVQDILRAEPGDVWIEYVPSGGETLSGWLCVHTRSPHTLQMEMSSPEFQVLQKGEGEHWIGLQIEGRPSELAGSTELRLFDASRPDGLIVPVSWRPAPRFRTVPQVISVGPVNAAPDGLTLDLLIIGSGAGTATVSPQADWVVIQESQAISDRCRRLTIRFTAGLKEVYRGPIAALEVDGARESISAEVQP